MRATIDFGIDLGTTNSAIAVLEGTRATVIKNNNSLEYTPSVVWIDKNNRLMVGRAAKMRLEQEPENVKSEFKLQMGAEYEYRFESTGRIFKPEELSAEVLKSLRADVQQRLGEDITAAVITVPAAFELPQCDATRRAAQLAGLQFSPLIMEPTAAAMAHAFQSKSDKVYWLVYDLGGGTFDAAVIQIREGTFRIVNHAGDNHLGGKLIDWEIVEKLLAPDVANKYRVSNFTRGNAQWRMAFAKLKYYAEEAKINLSTQESYFITIDYLCKDDNGEPVPFEYELKRSEVVRLARPFIQRSVNIARQALAESKLGIANVEKVVLVGGPTLAPYVREILEDAHEGLGIRLDYSVDPLTVVAQGAAIFAGMQRLEGAIPAPPPKESAGEEIYTVKLEYDPIGADPEPLVGGKIVPPAAQDLQGFQIEFSNSSSQPAWRSGKLALGSNGAFAATLWAQRGMPNIFKIELTDRNGRVLKVSPAEFSYTMGTRPGEQPLIHSIGVAKANNEVDWFMEKGTTLPARQRHILRSAITLHAGKQGEAIRIPVVEGSNERADRNKVIGSLVIPASAARRDVPAETEIEISLEIDASRIITASAYIGLLDQDFQAVIDYHKPAVDLDKMQQDLERQRKRLDTARQRTREVGDSGAREVLERKIEGENMVENVQSSLAAASGDPDAVDKAQNRLIDLKIAIDQVEDRLALPAMKQEAEEKITRVTEIVTQYGNSEARRQLEILVRDLRQALQSEDADLIRRKSEEIDTLAIMVLRERPEFWVGFFQHLEEYRARMVDQAAADQLISQGYQAMQANDLPRLKAIVQQLLGLLPQDVRDEIERISDVH